MEISMGEKPKITWGKMGKVTLRYRTKNSCYAPRESLHINAFEGGHSHQDTFVLQLNAKIHKISKNKRTVHKNKTSL